ncbi:hypothetical protein [Polyangium aurulentum]|uniref:hypothetical protein n=1 Tax=Polyangium aurulentum TaxID=2567896 RepID=UPI0010AE5AC0|nr:hypothetical protein [Polyangium aurulentum]UQA56832.1 hypothetical protein E8A73_036860 [Polyangium aurulentum]
MKRISVALCLFVAACGGEADDEPTPPPVAYKDMTLQQREVFMNDVVLPKMRATFAAFDAKYESTMTCQTCHGNGANDGTYAMPSPQVPPLPTEEEFPEYVKDPENAKWAQFMMDDVWPQMADLLDVPMYDHMTNPTGFSCSNCHTIASIMP